MGHDGISPEGQLDDSHPAHFASVPPFQIDITEVTVDAYRRCVEDGACSLPEQQPRELARPPCNWYETSRGHHPINCVSWHQADAYCKWTGKQLPTEEMWEFAARGKTERIFPWGPGAPGSRWGAPPDIFERLEGSCWTEDRKSNFDTCPVGSAPRGATPEGVLDLAGNVSEWTSSPYCKYAGKKCDDMVRGVRGGVNNWHSFPHWTWNTYRAGVEPGVTSNLVGFRCARLDKP